MDDERDGPTNATMATTVADLAVRAPKILPLEATVADAREMFASAHVHLALIVDGDRLVTTIERADIGADARGDELARTWGSLAGRTIDHAVRIDDAWDLLDREQRRRLVVIDEDGRLVGLLCLKNSRRGFCSDLGIASRAASSATQ